MSLALSLYDEVAVVARVDERVVIDIEGVGTDSLPRDEQHLMLRAMRAAAEEFGLDMGGVEIRARNAIPQGRGLGSSAATIAAGVTAAWMLIPGHDDVDRAAVLSVAAALEGHPDNVAACVYGGLTISWLTDQGAAAVAVDVHQDIHAELFLPPRGLSTDTARALLPVTVPHADAGFNAGRSALLIHALTSAPELLLDATEDRLHQPYRAAAMPESAALLGELRRAGIPAVISGAGPSVLVLTGAASRAEIEATEVPEGWTRQRLAVSSGLVATSEQDAGE
ncbi:MAG: homoserine kinase [Actinomycetota bacterium]|nr:homoserine kinase [Actinomycetota bacterium]